MEYRKELPENIQEMIRENLDKDYLLQKRTERISEETVLQEFCTICDTTDGLMEFLSYLKPDWTVAAEISKGKLVGISSLNGVLTFVENGELRVAEMLEMLQNTPKAQRFYLGKKELKLRRIYRREQTVILDFVKRPRKLFLLVGRTGSGKSTLASEISNRYQLPQVVSFTTRPMRAGEEIKADHYFIAPEDVEKYEDDMAAYTKIGAYEYFVTWSILKEKAAWIYVIDPIGVESLKRSIRENHMEDEFELCIFYLYVPPKVQMKRLAKRGDNPQVVKERLLSEDGQFCEFERNIPHMKDVYVLRNYQALPKVLKKLQRKMK